MLSIFSLCQILVNYRQNPSLRKTSDLQESLFSIHISLTNQYKTPKINIVKIARSTIYTMSLKLKNVCRKSQHFLAYFQLIIHKTAPITNGIITTIAICHHSRFSIILIFVRLCGPLSTILFY